MTERKPPPQDDDPLAELARIVSGRASFGQSKESAPQEPRAPEPESPQEPSFDLESELLNELQASFAALSEPLSDDESDTRDAEGERDSAPDDDFEPEEPVVPPPRREASPPPPPPAPPRRPDTEAPPSRMMTRHATPRDPSSRAESPSARMLERPSAPPPARSSEPQPPPSIRQDDGPGRRPSPVEPEDGEPLALPRFLSARDEPPPEPEPEVEVDDFDDQPEAPPIRQPAPRYADRLSRRNAARNATETLSGPMDEEPEEPVATRPASRLPAPPPEKEDEAPRTRRGLSRFAPQRAAAQIRSEPGPVIRPPRRAEPAPVPPPPEAVEPTEPPPLPAEDFDDAFSLDDLDTAAFGPEDELPPFPEEELDRRKSRRMSRTLAVVAVILVVGIAGATAAYFMGGEDINGQPPPIITADNGPTKIVPEDASAGEDQQGKLIYDRVDGEQPADTTLVTPGDAPVDEIPSTDAEDADNPIARVIIPGGPGFDGPLPEGESGAGTGDPLGGETDVASTSEDLGPRKVRTVVVKPDGTIVSSEAVAEGATTDDPAEIGNPLGVAPEVPDGRTEMDSVLDGGTELAVDPDPLNAASPERIQSAGLAEPLPGTDGASEPVTANDVPAAPPPPAEETQAPAPPPPQEETVVASTGNDSGPVDLAPETPAAPAPAPATTSTPQTTSGGALVQVSAQRSEADARTTFQQLQRQFPSILGPYQAAIIRADLDSGTWFRVRVGPFSDSDASRLCSDLKAAGGDCLVVR